MKQVTHFKPYVCYEIAIHGIYHYVGCHTQECKSSLTEKEILIESGNYLKTQINKTITRQEYYDCVELIKVWEFDDKQSALDFEAKQIQECKRLYKDLCVNKALYGNKAGSKGVEWSEEHKQRMSEVLKGEKSPCYGRKHTEEEKKKMSEAKKGENHPFYGKHFSDEHKEHIAISNRNNPKQNLRPVQQFTREGQFVKEYPSMMEAYRQTSINRGHIGACCQGKRPSAGGSIWKYA